MAADGYFGYTKIMHNFTTGLPIDVMFGSRVGFPAELRFLPGSFIHALLSRVTLASAGLSCLRIAFIVNLPVLFVKFTRV